MRFLGSIAVALTILLSPAPTVRAQLAPSRITLVAVSGQVNQQKLDRRKRLFQQSITSLRSGRMEEALKTAEQAVALSRELFGAGHLKVAEMLDLVATIYEQQSDLEAALETREQILEIRQTKLRQGHWEILDARLAVDKIGRLMELTDDERKTLAGADRLQLQANQLYVRGNYEAAAGTLRQSLEIQNRILGDNHAAIAETLNAIGFMLKKSANYSEALPFYERGLKLTREIYGSRHPLTARSLNNLGALFLAIGQFDRTLEHYREALNIRRELLGDKHIDTARSVNNMAFLLHSLGRYDEARPLYDKALATWSDLLGGDHPETLMVRNNLGNLNADMGNYRVALTYHEQVLSARNRILGSEHPDTATSLNNVGTALVGLGRWAEGRRYHEQALTIRRKVLGATHPNYAESLNNLASLLSDLGDHAAAVPLYQEAIAISTSKQEAVTAAHTTAGLALALHNLSRFGESFKHSLKALEMKQSILPKDHPEIALSHNNLGSLLTDLGQWELARLQLGQALRIWTNAKHPRIHFALANLGRLERDAGNYDAARRYHRRELEVCRTTWGDQHFQTAEGHFRTGWACYFSGDLESARDHFRQGQDISLRICRDLLPALSEAEALGYLQSAAIGGKALLQVHGELKLADPAAAYAILWNTRALATRAIAQRAKFSRDDPDARVLRDQLQTVRKQLAQLTLASVANLQVELRQKKLGELNTKKENLERKFAELAGDTDLSPVQSSPSDLIALIPDGTALVEVVLVNRWEEESRKQRIIQGTPFYEAFVIKQTAEKGKRSTISRVLLGRADEIDRAVRGWRDQLVREGGRGLRVSTDSNKKTPGKTPDQVLRETVWNRIEPSLGGAKSVIIVPDGNLTALPWSALPGKKTHSFLVEEYAIGVASSGSQLLGLLQEKPPASNELLLVGTVSYDRSSPPPNQNGSSASTRDRLPALDASERPRWKYLPATAEENAAIQKLSPAKAQVLEGAGATESAVLESLSQARYVHLATHGFFSHTKFRSAFEHDVQREKLFGNFQYTRGTVTGRNPLILSGLVLAGANTPGETNRWGSPIGHDNILTAEEIASLNLAQSELITLSACETGLGELAGGEGVFGLQRAFHMAGARSVIASLWKVDDDATRELMVEFYRNHWSKGLGKLESLRRAQVTVLNRYDPKGRTLRGLAVAGNPKQGMTRLSPFYWAAFTLSGDWR